MPNGQPDTSFGNAGKVVTSLTTSFDAGYALVLQPDGKLVAGGYAAGSGHPDFALVRYLTTGLPDESFGNQGITTTNFNSFTDQISALTIALDGKIIAAGRSNNGSNFDLAVARYISGLLVGAVDFSAPDAALTIAPNPVTDQARLRYNLGKETTLSLCLFDISGYLVQSFFIGEMREAGPQSELLYFGKNIPAGNYMLVLNSSSDKRCIRVVKN